MLAMSPLAAWSPPALFSEQSAPVVFDAVPAVLELPLRSKAQALVGSSINIGS